MTKKYSFEDLKYLMARLRDKQDGCPWDIKQTYQTIVPHTLEEVYEVIDTIERNDYEHLSEELGDLLFQVVFYAQIAADEQRFELDDVIHQLVAKLVYRHPHVFPEGELNARNTGAALAEDRVGNQWEMLKQQEARKQQQGSVLSDVPKALPGLIRAKKLQAKAAKVGFDWPDIASVFDKVHEELDELKEAVLTGDKRHIEDELGDLFFALANVARHAQIDPEQAVRSTNQKFINRFSYVEAQVAQSPQDWPDYSLAELDAFWDQAKVIERQK